MVEQDILQFLDEKNYDIRISHNGRWIDQKCTPDVLWSICDFILNMVGIYDNFTVSDVWQSEYAKLTIRETFSKPDTDDVSAENEYDKVFSQPINLLCYAGVLEDISPTTRHLYEVRNLDVLEYIAANDRNALRFIQMYVEKVLKDSGLFGSFENFFTQQNKNSFEDLKQSFVDFYHNFTPVRGEYEPKRIFSRVLNPLSLKYRKLGTERGRMSPHIITKSDLMYNRDNFRDVYKDKPKEISRKDWLVQHPEIHIRTGYFEQQMNAAKNQLRMVNDIYRHNISELTQFIQGETDDIPASQIHHIFPRNEFPEIMYYPENLIALTPNQHFMFAHPNNNTQIIDTGNHNTLPIAKTYSIRKNLTEEDRKIYDFDNLLLILNVGWDDDSVLEIETGNYNDVIHSINCHYALI